MLKRTTMLHAVADVLCSYCCCCCSAGRERLRRNLQHADTYIIAACSYHICAVLTSYLYCCYRCAARTGELEELNLQHASHSLATLTYTNHIHAYTCVCPFLCVLMDG
jgi:hypothetical protein